MGDDRGGVVVTGASRRIGIGSEVVRSLAADGWRVFATWFTPYDESMRWGSDRDEIADLLAQTGSHGMEADLGDRQTPRAVFEAAESAIGPIRALVNVHTYDPGGGIAEVSGDELDRHLSINVRGTYLLCQEFAARYSLEASDRRTGRIVSFLSGPPLVGSVAYAMSKGAVQWMTWSLAGELAPRGITVNAINPGPTDTGWMPEELHHRLARSNPIGRVSTPTDAANLVRFLLSDEGGFINAQCIDSDGGFAALALSRLADPI